jgi:MOSC domain-containing protein YiiM
MNLGDKVEATNRKTTAELTVTQLLNVSDASKIAKPGIVARFIAEGRVKKSDWCKLGEKYENGSIVWLT